MRRSHVVACVALATAMPGLASPADASATGDVAGTLQLLSGVCTSATSCLVVGADASGNGAIVPVAEEESQGTVAACTSDAETVGIAVAAYEAENPGKIPTTGAAWKAALLSHKNHGPFLLSWPDGHARVYTIEVAGAATGRTSGDGVKTVNGDVIVTAVENAGRTYDATVNPLDACTSLNDVVPVAGTEVSDSATDPIEGLACPSGSSTCYGAAQDVSPSEGAIVEIGAITSSQPTVTANVPVALTTALSSIACPSSTACVAVGTGPSSQGVAVPVMGGVVGTAQSAADVSLRAIACGSPSLCMAVGEASPSDEGAIVPIDVASTSITLGTPVDVPSATALDGVACPTPTSCVAVGDEVTPSADPNGVIVPFDVAGGLPTPSRAQVLASTWDLAAIECLSANACDAVGVQVETNDYGILVGVSQGKAGAPQRIAGASWTSGIACIGTSRCLGFSTGTGTGDAATGAIEALAPSIRTAVTLRASSNTARAGHLVALRASVDPRSSSGSVAFTSDGNTIAGCRAVAVSSGSARCVLRLTTTGTVVLRATYSGDADESSSTSKPVVERVVV